MLMGERFALRAVRHDCVAFDAVMFCSLIFWCCVTRPVRLPYVTYFTWPLFTCARFELFVAWW